MDYSKDIITETERNNDIQPKDIRKAEKAYKFYKKFVNEIKDLQTSRRMIKNTINKAKLKLKNETGQKRKTEAQKRKKRNKTKAKKEQKMQKTKKAKREEKKQSYFKSNFLTNESYFKQQPYDTTETKNELDSKWNEILENKIKEIFPPNLINTNLLTRSLQHFINENKPKINKELIEVNENEEEHIKENLPDENDNKDDNKDKDPKASQSDLNKSRKGEKEKLLDDLTEKDKDYKEKKKLLNYLIEKDKDYKEKLNETKEFLEEMEQDMKKFENKQYNEIVNKKENNENENIDETKNDIIIKERILNYTMKLNQFSLVKIVTFWKENIPKLKEQLKKDPNYKTHPQEKKNFNDKEITKQPKAVNVKHIYSEPSEEIRKMIPFCPKKFTIQKKDA